MGCPFLLVACGRVFCWTGIRSICHNYEDTTWTVTPHELLRVAELENLKPFQVAQTMSTTSRCLALAVAILSFGTSLLAQTQTRPDATRILNNMFRVYSRAASYQDEGLLVTTT